MVKGKENVGVRVAPLVSHRAAGMVLAVLLCLWNFRVLSDSKEQPKDPLKPPAKELPWPTQLDHRAWSREEVYFPKVGEYTVLKGDFHCHTIYSDGQVTPEVRVWEAWRDGLDILSLTDHPEYMDLAIGPETGRAFGRVRSLASELGLILIHGAELTTQNSSPAPFSDYVVNFITNEPAMKGDFFPAIQSARNQGATIIWAHPGTNWTNEARRLLEQGWLDGIELRNAQAAGSEGTVYKEGILFYPQVMDWCIQNNLAVFAVSDAHWPIDDYYSFPRKVRRDLTLVLSRSLDQAGVKEAIQQRRTVACFGEMLWGAEHWVKGIAEAAISITGTALIRPKGQIFAIFVTNQSSFPFKVFFSANPNDGWFRPDLIQLAPRATTMVPFTLTRKEPSASPMTISLKLSNVFTGIERPLQLTRSLPAPPVRKESARP